MEFQLNRLAYLSVFSISSLEEGLANHARKEYKNNEVATAAIRELSMWKRRVKNAITCW